MAVVLRNFDAYGVGYTARGQGTQIVTAVINCYQQGAWVAQIQFLPQSLPFNDGGGLGGGDLLVLYYEPTQFQDVLAILQREGPLAVWFDLDQSYGYILTTSPEPVGEMEDLVQQLVPVGRSDV
ncbi:hypothetical protein EV644_123103 [Kribbella orskensis]|uniref:Uncharacterized protein n=1 Tax=Kribbella orskensis TaxID=2512216 RepID=A0ABY2BAI1_9ACTN|nr:MULTISPECIES: hypothetical protein [Kribbella]TCN32855.1 hypothetical protein EV642_12520 [Kribbella sp. VKM Ac-2500]TCO13271.1 hypothetical protein EV644_123103 [Kribbella orskensis]